MNDSSRLKIGLTGGIGSGKSTVARLFSNKGIAIIDADQIARQLFSTGSEHLSALREHFGDKIFLANGDLNRQALRAIVFNSPEELEWLNCFTHPKVADKLNEHLEAASSDYVIFDIPLLINTEGKVPKHLMPFIDRILVVDVAPETQIKRVIERDQVPMEQVKQIIKSQSSREQKLALADDIIDNDGLISQLELQVDTLHNQYMQLSARNADGLQPE